MRAAAARIRHIRHTSTNDSTPHAMSTHACRRDFGLSSLTLSILPSLPQSLSPDRLRTVYIKDANFSPTIHCRCRCSGCFLQFRSLPNGQIRFLPVESYPLSQPFVTYVVLSLSFPPSLPF